MNTNDLKKIIIDDTEYKLTKIEKPKYKDTVFKIGDWIVFKKKPYFIYNEYSTEYGEYFYVRSIDGTMTNILKSEEIHRWTIKDAKEGDILFDTVSTFIYKGIDTENNYGGSRNAIIYHISLSSGKELNVKENIGVGSSEDINLRPATKEERELLFLTLSCYGYEWNSSKMELKKIIKRICTNCPFNESNVINR